MGSSTSNLKLTTSNYRYVIGIDEVGRGPIAGPVTVCAFAVQSEDLPRFNRLRLKDSKALSADVRCEWEEKFLKKAESRELFFSIASISHEVIDSSGITSAIRAAIDRALGDLALPPEDSLVLLDGGLKAPEIYRNQKTLIRGDEKIRVISAASIMAKVSRDRRMIDYGKEYPVYGFERHKGYCTEAHVRALNYYGPSPLHRLSFLSFLSESREPPTLREN